MSANGPWDPPTTGGPGPAGVPPWPPSAPPPAGPYGTGPAPYPGRSPYAPPPSPYGSAPQGAAPYGAAGVSPYGAAQAPYGAAQAPYGGAPYGSPPPYPPPPRRLTGGRLTLAVVGFFAVLAVIVGLIAAGASVLAPADGYGDDPQLDQLWDRCADGDGAACDDLYRDSPVGSEYEEFGDSCGHRVPPGRTYCEGVIDPPGFTV